MKKLSVILLFIIFSGCVENIITIRIHPDGRSHIQFFSKGDSLDIFNHDFIHPSSPNWRSIFTTSTNEDGDIIWEKLTDGFIASNSIISQNISDHSIGYIIESSINKNWFSTTYEFKVTFPKLLDYRGTPLLSESLLTDKMDSIQWLPEALMSIIDSALTQLYKDTKITLPYRQDRLSNHFKNTFAHIQSENLMDELHADRGLFLSRILKPFEQIDTLFISQLNTAMDPYESKLENIINLKDDQFKFRLITPGVVQSTNALAISNDTLKWEFGQNEFLNKPKILEATSRIYSIIDLQKTITFGLLILLIGVGLLYQKIFK
ncbi:MAG: hypothetical protein HOK52_07775 [Candidatus Marinimicrobia bacterium]|nr:hypothetical protein [Candidatus Neomarinimicrobiota bacterium]MBT4383668.1 hypothetical protein [Candidatus Neomarinimicrobiota bacterium]MBT4685725.1 hypothetical protein [Candidatus Neomarinimicrobiota bacterium]MBT6471143.1 hypothetical protein [Candidatus Neomarinimicrobiota bacterium]MBT6937706.1 hypothetical protein [Candidatus Neomarinimicrobiota bacterium]